MLCAGTDSNAVETLIALTAFEQAGLIRCPAEEPWRFGDARTVRICAEQNKKADLCETEIYAILMRQGGAQ